MLLSLEIYSENCKNRKGSEWPRPVWSQHLNMLCRPALSAWENCLWCYQGNEAVAMRWKLPRFNMEVISMATVFKQVKYRTSPVDIECTKWKLSEAVMPRVSCPSYSLWHESGILNRQNRDKQCSILTLLCRQRELCLSFSIKLFLCLDPFYRVHQGGIYFG